VLKNVVKWHAFIPASVHSSTPIQVSQEKMPTKVIKCGAIKGKKSPCSVLTSSPVIQKKKLKANHRKYNFKKTAHNPNSSNSDQNNDSEC
jgi:hypothetical protein